MIFKPRVESFWVDVGFASPFCHRMSLALMRQQPVIPPIVLLFLLCTPTAIPRLIVAVIVDAVKGHAWRWFAHVGKEVLKLPPPFADRNSAPTVVVIVGVVWVDTAAQHVAPDSVNSAASHAMTAICFSAFFSSLFVKASTTLGIPRMQAHSSYDGGIPAITAAKPETFTTLIEANEFQNYKPGKSQAGDIFEIMIGWFKIAFSHIAYLQYAVVRAVSGHQLIGGSSFIAYSRIIINMEIHGMKMMKGKKGMGKMEDE